MTSSLSLPDTTVIIFAAGSLRNALAGIVQELFQTRRIDVKIELGPSGVLRERIEEGQNADIFISADFSHARRLADLKLAEQAIAFADNCLSLFGHFTPKTDLDGIIDLMLDPGYRLGTSTPGDDPGGDYAFRVFEKIDGFRPGACEKLSARSLQLVGGRNSRPVPKGKHPVLYLFERKEIDLFLGYHTSALDIQKQINTIQIQQLPEQLSVKPEYFLSKIIPARPCVDQVMDFLLSKAAGAILSFHGFSPAIRFPQ